MRILKPRLWWYVALAGVALLPLLLLTPARRSPRQGLQFRNVKELKAWAEGRGLYCRSDWEDGRVTDGLAISTRPLSWEQVGRLCRSAPGNGAAWEGILWAMAPPADRDGVPVPPWAGECRAWGGILVTGDRALLDRLEAEAK
jgi:hypothetical protein